MNKPDRQGTLRAGDHGNIYQFLDHPIVVAFLLFSIVFLCLPMVMRMRGTTPQRLVEDDD